MKHLVLVGAGHAHAQVLLAWAANPLPDVVLTLVSPEPLAPYSGMVPGWLAGRYQFEEITIDFGALCAAAGAHWVEAELERLDPEKQSLHLSTGESLVYDIVSLNVGSTLRPPAPSDTSTTLISMRPLSELRGRYQAFVDNWSAERTDQPLTVTAVGGGAAGFESMLAVLHRLRQARPGRQVNGALVSSGTILLPGFAPAARRSALRALEKAGVVVQLGGTWGANAERTSGLVLWATGAQAHDWQLDPLRRGHLAVSKQGFVRVDSQLRSLSHPQIFAVGDCTQWGSDEADALPKAGVYAVRMGPVLSQNLRATLLGTPLTAYAPQRRFLALLATADGHAIASRGGWGASGAWAWHLKDYIDRRFMRRFAMGPRLNAPPHRAPLLPTTSALTGENP